MSKKFIFYIGLIGIALGYVLSSPLQFGFCQNTYTFGDELGCLDKTVPIIGQVIGLLSIPILIFSIITYFLREEVFRAWARFAYWWIPLSLIMVYLSAGWGGGGGWGMPDLLDQETVAFVFAALFSLISLFLIIIKWLLQRFKS